MLVAPVRFPITDGVLVAELKSKLTVSWSPIIVQRKRPTAMPRRLLTVRNDSGPQEQLRSFRRYGFNVWADDSVDAENICLDAMATLRVFRTHAITVIDSFSGPYEVEDETPFVVSGKTLAHFYFGARLSVRGSD